MNLRYLRLLDESGRKDMFVCVLCNTGSMQRKNAEMHLNGSRHSQALESERFKERLGDRALTTMNMWDVKSQVRNLGLPSWRHHIKAKLYEYIFAEDMQPLNSIHELLRKYTKLEKTSLLELAVWKARCLWLDGSQSFNTMQDILDQWTIDENFDPAAFKAERRYASNVAVIMRGVVQFLE